ncbi:MAG TPA: hypothetical protein VEV38_05595 [Candidatus Eremiobacteraceae bacterium]|nr:hypothetical protein [Candidatus Eremiobacteraceae bacterium]
MSVVGHDATPAARVRKRSKFWTIVTASGVGIIGGAFCGFVIMGLFALANNPPVDATNVFGAGLIGAVFGAPFGLFAFPACYLSICGDVPTLRVAAYAVPATIIGGVLWMVLISSFGAPFENQASSFWLDIYSGGLLGLLIACIALRIASTRSRRSR